MKEIDLAELEAVCARAKRGEPEARAWLEKHASLMIEALVTEVRATRKDGVLWKNGLPSSKNSSVRFELNCRSSQRRRGSFN